MYAYIKGELTYKNDNQIVIETNGIGYLLITGAILLTEFPNIGETVIAYTSFQVREDSMVLYAFPKEVQKKFFELLLSVGGVGPKLALSLVDQISPEDFAIAILQKKKEKLLKLKGLGKKTVERIILELQDKLKKTEWANASDLELSDDTEALDNEQPLENETTDLAKRELLEALSVLGYSHLEAKAMLKVSFDSNLDLEGNLRRILSRNYSK